MTLDGAAVIAVAVAAFFTRDSPAFGGVVIALGAFILGHMLPVTRKFKGGRGVATGGGVMLVLFPALTVAMTVLWVVLARVLPPEPRLACH